MWRTTNSSVHFLCDSRMWSITPATLSRTIQQTSLISLLVGIYRLSRRCLNFLQLVLPLLLDSACEHTTICVYNVGHTVGYNVVTAIYCVFTFW